MPTKPFNIVPAFINSLIIVIVAVFALMQPNYSEAKSASYNTLKASLAEQTKQNEIQHQQMASLAETAELQRQQIQQLHTATEKALNKEAPVDPFLTVFRIITLFTLGLLAFTLYTLVYRYLPSFDNYKTLLREQQEITNKQQNVIDEQQRNMLQIHKNTTITAQALAKTKAEVIGLKAAQQLSKDQAAIALEILEKQLRSPLEAGLSEQNRATIIELLDDGHLSFDNTLRAKALIAEHDEEWLDAIQFWETVLVEKPENNEALLHIGFANFKLAANHRKDQTYLNKAVDTYHHIMSSAPEYFEDAYGFDDQSVEPEEHVGNADDFWIFQQVEGLIFKTDELKNYHSILNIACQYSVDGQLDDARDCLEQVSPIYHASNCKQLQEDTDLDSVRDQEWFKKIVKDACTTKTKIALDITDDPESSP